MKERKIGRDARTGRFIPVEKAEKDPEHTVVETFITIKSNYKKVSWLAPRRKK